MANIAVRALRLAARTQQPLLYVTQVRTNKKHLFLNPEVVYIFVNDNINIDPGKAALHKSKLVEQL